MKTVKLLFILSAFFITYSSSLHAQGVAINEDGSDPDASAILDIQSTTMGVLVPRLTKTQRDAISSPPTGLIIFQTDDTTGFYFYSGSKWVVIGSEALSINDLYDGKTGGNSVFLGAGAGFSDDATDNLNTGIGDSALYSNSSGYKNTASGYMALYSNLGGYNNTATGYKSLVSNTTGRYNTSIGSLSLYSSTTANSNTAIGESSLYTNTTGHSNTATGRSALYNNTTGYHNTAIGLDVLRSNTTGNYNTAVGSLTLRNNQTGTSNSAFGNEALYSNTTGINNTSSGLRSLYSNTTGHYNTALGYKALYSGEENSNNTAIGFESLTNNIDGGNNTAVGMRAMVDHKTGSYNVAIGGRALFNDTSGTYNIAIGYSSLYENINGSKNMGIGYYSNRYNQEGSYNTIVGIEAGRGTSLHSKSGNVFLGYRAGYNDTTDNKLYIENSNSTSPLIWGDFANDTVRINGTLDIAGTFHFPTADGTNGQILKTDGSGSLTWTNNAGATALQWSDTSNKLVTDYDLSFKQDIADTSTVDATRYWVGQQNYLTAVSINDLTDGKTGGKSVFLGNGSGNNDDGSDNENVAVGDSALHNNNSGAWNVACGFGSLFSNTGGWNNTAIGHKALNKNTGGFENHASGNYALFNNTGGDQNSSTGFKSLYANTTGNQNTANGWYALSSNTEGNYNTASGSWSLLNNTYGEYNTADGYKALGSNTEGDKNTACGYNALSRNTAGSYNVGLGGRSNYFNQQGNYNTVVGYEAGGYGSPHNKHGNVLLGYRAGYQATGDSNVLIGIRAGYNASGDHKLYIDNSNTSTPLVYGEFNNDLLRINGTLNIAGLYSLPDTDGSSGQILKTDGGGNLSWIGNVGDTALQWADTSNQLATDYDVSFKQDISDTSTVDATRYWVEQQGYLTTALQWSDTSNQLATDYDISSKQNISDTSTVDATRHWVEQQGYVSTISIDGLTDAISVGNSVFLGAGSGIADDSTDNKNVGVGIDALHSNSSGFNNTAIGGGADYNNETGSNNTIIGYQAGFGSGAHNKTGSVFLGYRAGYNEHESDKLYIENSNSSSPLIWGDFANDTVRINGVFDIAGAYHFPIAAGTNGQILRTDGSGVLNWVDNSGASALQWADTSAQLATDHNVSLKQNISDTSTVDATRYWVDQQGYLTSALQWSDTSNQLATDYDVSSRQNISDTLTVDATRHWVEQQSYITGVGSMTYGNVFAGSSADDQWLGLGASAGRILFDNLTTDEINFLDAEVGIGTSAPFETLHIAEDNNTTDGTDGSFMLIQNTNSTNDVMSGLRFQNGTSSNTAKGGIYYRDELNYGRGDMVFVNNSTATLGDATFADTRLIIKNGGKVGIGTNNPQAQLQVDGGIQVADDNDTPTADKAGTIRYRVDGNTSYAEMCMQTAAGTWSWVVIKSNTWF